MENACERLLALDSGSRHCDSCRVPGFDDHKGLRRAGLLDIGGDDKQGRDKSGEGRG